MLGWVLGACRSISYLSNGSARAMLQLARGRVKTAQIIAGSLFSASTFFLICPKKHPKQGTALPSPVVSSESMLSIGS